MENSTQLSGWGLTGVLTLVAIRSKLESNGYQLSSLSPEERAYLLLCSPANSDN